MKTEISTKKGRIHKLTVFDPEASAYNKERKRIEKVIANMIQRKTSFFNGWAVSNEAERDACEDSARLIMNYLVGK